MSAKPTDQARRCVVCGCDLPPCEVPPEAVAVWPGVLEATRRWNVACDACVDAAESRERDAERSRVATGQREALIAVGLLPATSRVAQFKGGPGPVADVDLPHWHRLERLKNFREHCWYLYGTPGSGKTHVGLCLLNRALERGLSVAWTTASRFVSQACYDRKHCDRYEDAGLLLIDDAHGAGWHRAGAVAALHTLLDRRYERQRRTVITSQFPATPGQRGTKYETSWAEQLLRGCDYSATVQAALDRLKPCKHMEFTGPSMRGRIETETEELTL